jgi:hypothetical protein
MVKKIIILLILIFPTTVYCAPSIENINTATVSDGDSITITGSDFGSTGPVVQIFDDFEGGTDETNIPVAGSSLATVGTWDRTSGDGSQIFYSNDYAISGSLAFQARSGPGYSGEGIAIESDFSAGTKQVYLVYWSYFPAESEWPTALFGDDWLPGWKPVWVHTDISHTNSDFVCRNMNTIISDDVASGRWFFGNNDGSYISSYVTFNRAQWYRYAVYYSGSASGSGIARADAIVYNGSNTSTTLVNDTGLTNMDSAGDDYSLVELGAWSRVHPTVVAKFIFDDFYLATGAGCRARVEIGDNPSYASCTNLAICTPTNWGDSSVTATVRTGGFADGTAYLFVVDANGDASAGEEITIGEGSTPASISRATVSRMAGSMK